MATKYFVKTVTEDCPNPWTGHPCGSYLSYTLGLCNGCGDDGCPLMGYRAEETKLNGKFYLNTGTWDTLCRELFSLILFICMPDSPSVGSIIKVGNSISRLKVINTSARLKCFEGRYFEMVASSSLGIFSIDYFNDYSNAVNLIG